MIAIDVPFMGSDRAPQSGILRVLLRICLFLTMGVHVALLGSVLRMAGFPFHARGRDCSQLAAAQSVQAIPRLFGYVPRK
jgi:hypothetical protein